MDFDRGQSYPKEGLITIGLTNLSTNLLLEFFQNQSMGVIRIH